MSLLTIIQNSCKRLGLPAPTSVIGASDAQTLQLLAIANQEGKELAKRFPWQLLIKEKTFTATATETQSSVIPTDFDHIINNTFYNRTSHRWVEGPLDAVEWQRYKASTTTLISDAYRIRGNSLLIAPTPTAGDSYAFEYLSTYWAATASASTTPAQTEWNADDDVGILPEELMTDGVVWRFRKAKGLPYEEEFRTYEMQVMMRAARDQGRRVVNMGRSFDYRRVRRPNWPDGSWSLT